MIHHSGTATLGGSLAVSLLGGFTPSAGDAFEFITTAGSVSGEFASENLPALRGGLFFNVEYAAHSVTLFTAGVVGDYNRNGKVDAADYTIWRNALNNPSASLAADGSGDHQITRLDFDVWKAHFGETAMFGTGDLSAVPEPASAMLIACAAASVALIRRPLSPKHRQESPSILFRVWINNFKTKI